MLLKEQPDGTTRLSRAHEARRRRRDGADRRVRRRRARPGLGRDDRAARRRGRGRGGRGRAPAGLGRAPVRRAARRRPRRRPRRREALGPDLARRRRARPAPVLDAPRRPWRHARPVRGRRAARVPRPRDPARRVPPRRDRRRYRATICFGEQSTTDDIDGQRTPVDGPPVTREAVEAALATVHRRRSARSRPNYSAVQIEGRRAYQLARSGETVVLAARDVDDPRARAPRVGRQRPRAADRGRRRLVLRRDVHPRARPRPRGAARERARTSARWCGPASGGFRLEDAVALDDLREAAADGPAGVARVLRPIDAGLEHLPHADVTDDEIRRLGRGPDHRAEARPRGSRRADRARGRARRDGRGGVPVRRGGAVPAQGARRAPETSARGSARSPSPGLSR